MIFSGQAIQISQLDDNILHLQFDLQGESVNKFSQLVMSELDQSLTEIEKQKNVKGMVLSSAKSAFFVGADITEFLGLFDLETVKIEESIGYCNLQFTRIEKLPFPTVVIINGYALGGGLEVCLGCDYRVALSGAKVGLPETKLGILPGWGGTTRLPRIAGVDVAVEWISGAKEASAEEALSAGVVDAVTDQDKGLRVALRMIDDANAPGSDWLNRRQAKESPLAHNDIESLLAFESSKAFVKAKAGRHYPAPVKAIQVIQDAAKMSRDEALKVETSAFVALAKGDVAKSLVGLFLGDQALNKKAKKLAKEVPPVLSASVIGAGIMGGGIAYQSAYKGVPITMKDVVQSGLDLGMSEAAKLLSKRVERGRMSTEKMANTLNKITPTLDVNAIKNSDIVVEAVVENPTVKQSVLKEIELNADDGTVICSNTSTISIDYLAQALTKPENFCGMHFFNPVHKMPLVEVIRGSKTSDNAVQKTVSYALSLGKKPVVVRDCPGFLVNRVLFPYFAGFALLVRDGVNYQRIDKVMERWGWPMGPAYLMDVVGIDTGVHAEKVMAEGFPDRMSRDFKSVADVLYENKLFGQKNGEGFYVYSTNKKGKPEKKPNNRTASLFADVSAPEMDIPDEDIVARMMIPMATEMARCLEEGIIDSAYEADMALIFGLGFPPFRGGIFRWLDDLGLTHFMAQCEQFENLGPLYQPTAGMRTMLEQKHQFYPLSKKGE